MGLSCPLTWSPSLGQTVKSPSTDMAQAGTSESLRTVQPENTVNHVPKWGRWIQKVDGVNQSQKSSGTEKRSGSSMCYSRYLHVCPIHTRLLKPWDQHQMDLGRFEPPRRVGFSLFKVESSLLSFHTAWALKWMADPRPGSSVSHICPWKVSAVTLIYAPAHGSEHSVNLMQKKLVRITSITCLRGQRNHLHWGNAKPLSWSIEYMVQLK